MTRIGTNRRGDVVPMPDECEAPPVLPAGRRWVIGVTDGGAVRAFRYRTPEGDHRVGVASGVKRHLAREDAAFGCRMPAAFAAAFAARALGLDAWVPVAMEFRVSKVKGERPGWRQRPLFGGYVFLGVGEGQEALLREVACLRGVLFARADMRVEVGQGVIERAHGVQVEARLAAMRRVTGADVGVGDAVALGGTLDLRALVTGIDGARVRAVLPNGMRARVGLARVAKVG